MLKSIPARKFGFEISPWEPEPFSITERRSRRRRGNRAWKWLPQPGKKSLKPGKSQTRGQVESSRCRQGFPHIHRFAEFQVCEMMEHYLDSFPCICPWKWRRGDFQPFRPIDSSCPCLDLRNSKVSQELLQVQYNHCRQHHSSASVSQLPVYSVGSKKSRFNTEVLPLKTPGLN